MAGCTTTSDCFLASADFLGLNVYIASALPEFYCTVWVLDCMTIGWWVEALTMLIVDISFWNRVRVLFVCCAPTLGLAYTWLPGQNMGDERQNCSLSSGLDSRFTGRTWILQLCDYLQVVHGWNTRSAEIIRLNIFSPNCCFYLHSFIDCNKWHGSFSTNMCQCH